MTAYLQKKLEEKLGTNVFNNYEYSSLDNKSKKDISCRSVRGSVRMQLNRIFTPKDLEVQIGSFLNTAMPR